MSSDPRGERPNTISPTFHTDSRRNHGNSVNTSSSSTAPIIVVENTEPRAPAIVEDDAEPFPSLPSEPTSRVVSRVRTREGPSEAPSIHLAPPSTTTARTSRRRPIGIKRLSSNDTRIPRVQDQTQTTALTGRKRGVSAPLRPSSGGSDVVDYANDGSGLRPSVTTASNLPPLVEGMEAHMHSARKGEEHSQTDTRPARSGSNRMRRMSDAARSVASRIGGPSDDIINPRHDENEYDNDVVDLLDVIDPEVSTLTTLTNVQNSLFVPDLGRWLNRRPTYELSGISRVASRDKPLPPTPSSGIAPPPRAVTAPEIMSDIEEEPITPRPRTNSGSAPSIASVVREEHFAVLPHGVSLEGWTEEEKQLLDDHVRHMLHSRRSRFKRSMRAFGKYVSKPLGFFVTLYAVLITLFGLAWVLFLIGWIYVGERQLYIINIIDNVLVALFAIMGDGLAPFRIVDTYHMCFIAHYHHLSWRLRKERALPKLQDHNDLPEKQPKELDLEAANDEDAEFSVLTPEQQKKLQHHSEKFSKSHSFYKPHETTTHHAFPLRLLVAIVVLLDFHSIFQIALGACTWSISYHVRPEALTATILSCSITVNITAGILIKVGDKKTRKKDVLLRMDRQALTTQAMKKVERHKKAEIEGDKKLDEELDEEWEKKHNIVGTETVQENAKDKRG